MKKPVTYRTAGVDIDEGERLVRRIRPMVRTTHRKEVLGEIGSFAGFFRFPARKYRDPVLVSGTDGVGTKVKVAAAAGKFDTVGIDLVAMCVNDILVHGAEPLFFLDYYATGKLSADHGAQVVSGVAEGCRQAGCALLGGETAEMPSVYARGEFDLAGFAVGAVDRGKIIDGALRSPRRPARGARLLRPPQQRVLPGEEGRLRHPPQADRPARPRVGRDGRGGASAPHPHLRAPRPLPAPEGDDPRHGPHHRGGDHRERPAFPAGRRHGGRRPVRVGSPARLPARSARRRACPTKRRSAPSTWGSGWCSCCGRGTRTGRSPISGAPAFRPP